MNRSPLKIALTELGDPAGLGALCREVPETAAAKDLGAMLCNGVQKHFLALPLKHAQPDTLLAMARTRTELALQVTTMLQGADGTAILMACALLDVGKAALDALSPSGISWTHDPPGSAAATALDEETRAHGADHALLGKWTLEHWGLPMQVSEAVWLHHHNLDTVALTAERADVCFATMLVDALADAKRCGNVVAPSAWMEQLATRLGVSAKDMLGLVQPSEQTVLAESAQLGVVEERDAPQDRMVALVAMHDRLHRAATENEVLFALAYALRDVLGAPQGECAGDVGAVVWTAQGEPECCLATAIEVPNVPHAIAVPLAHAGEQLGKVWLALPGHANTPIAAAMLETTRLVETCARVLARLRSARRNADRVEGLASALHAAEAAHVRALEVDRLDALSRFAAGAAHEINNPLAVISGRAQLLVSQASSPEHIRALEAIIGQSRRISKIVNDLMQFARPTGVKASLVGAPYLMHQVLAPMRERFAQKQIEIVEHYARELPRVRVDRHQLERGFINVLLNAEQAMQRAGGTLTVEVQVGTNNAVEILMRDTGPGIAPEHLGRIFDPFFTTRESQEGSTGLGLTVCRSIVEAHGGRVTVSSRLGEGALVKIALPAAEATPRAAEPVPPIVLADVLPESVESPALVAKQEEAPLPAIAAEVEPLAKPTPTIEVVETVSTTPAPVAAAIERVFMRSATLSPTRSAAPPAVMPAQGRILVIEENEDLREVLRAGLAARGFEIETAPDGLEGLANALAHTPSLIVCATRLTGVDTVTLIRQVRQRFANLPVIVLAGPGSDEDAAEALQAGARALLHKPFDFERLLQEVSRYLVAQNVA